MRRGAQRLIDQAIEAELVELISPAVDNLRAGCLEHPAHHIDRGVVTVEQTCRGDESDRCVADVFPEGRQANLLRTKLANLALPVRVIWGSEDKTIPASHAQGLRQRVRVEVLPDSGHMVQMEAATWVNRLLEAAGRRAKGTFQNGAWAFAH